MNSSKMGTSQTLARMSAEKMEQFLRELVNLHPDGFERFQNQFGHLIPPRRLGEGNVWVMDAITNSEYNQSKEEIAESTIRDYQQQIRRIWTVSDLRTKRFGIFLIWYQALAFEDPRYTMSLAFPIPLGPARPFEQVLEYMLTHSDKMRFCGNTECPAPYFFAKRRSQKYCSEACALPAQQAHKRQWWAEHGEEHRESRKMKTAKPDEKLVKRKAEKKSTK